MLRGDRLRSLRLNKNYTHDELAELLNLNIRQIARYESGDTDPSGAIIARIANVFTVSADYLLGLTDDPTPPIDSEDLSERERKIIAALRDGDLATALKEITATN